MCTGRVCWHSVLPTPSPPQRHIPRQLLSRSWDRPAEWESRNTNAHVLWVMRSTPPPTAVPVGGRPPPTAFFFRFFWDKFALDSNGIFWTHRRSTPPPTGNRRVGQPSQLLPPRLPPPEGGPSKVASGPAWSNEMRQNCFREKVSQSCGIFEGLGFALQNAGQKIRLDLCVFGTVRDKVWGKSAPPPPPPHSWG